MRVHKPNYILLIPPFVMPFVLLFMARAIWWLAGAEWIADDAAILSLLFGVVLGGGVSAILLQERE